MSTMSSEIIFLSSGAQYPITAGGRIRETHLLNLLAEKCSLEILCFSAESFELSELSPKIRVTLIEKEPSNPWDAWKQRVIPPIARGYSERMANAIRERASPGKILWASRLSLAHYLPLARSLGYRTVLEQQVMETRTLLNEAFSSPLQWHKGVHALGSAFIEQRYCAMADILIAPSDRTAARLSKIAPDALIQVLPCTVDSERYLDARDSQGTDLFFSGTLNFGPNIEGLGWFVREILPRLKAALASKLPRIVVAGSNPGKELRTELEGSGIQVHANPESMLPFLRQAAVVFVPVRSGGGIPLKVLEGMASGKPVVATGCATEGLVLTPTYDILIADRADAFSAAIVRLLRNPELRQKIGRNAAESIEKIYDWRASRPRVEEFLARLNCL